MGGVKSGVCTGEVYGRGVSRRGVSRRGVFRW